MTAADFRVAYPQFTEDKHPDSRIEYHIRIAKRRVSPDRWDDLYEEGLGLLVAHYLALDDMARANNGAAVGAVTSQSKSVGGMSKSVGYAAPAQSGSGIESATIYGQRYADLVLIVGAGALQL